ncbi:MAG: FlgO family outer membrane protein [Desulfobulbus sp.]|nr:FlgO family outer membrane protein [Desulfobulbus sp.]
MIRIRRLVVLPALLLTVFCILGGCSQLNGTRLEPLLGGDVDLAALGDEVAANLASQPVPPLMPNQPEQPILVTTLVNNDNLNDTSSFGRTFQNSIAAGFAKRAYSVKEIKLRRDLVVKKDEGEFMLTRNLQEMAGTQRAQAVVVGTYTLANRVLYLSVRLVSPHNQAIIGAYEDKIYLDENSLRLFGLKFKDNTDEDPIHPVMPPPPSALDKILY